MPTKRAWFHVWDADDNRPPLVDGEFEIYGRFAGDDGDLDGHVAPADCNDANAAIFPGAVDVLDNGVDEDCSGADAENQDRDGDGVFRSADCNDGNGSVRPGAADIPDNGVDEDCSGADAINFDRDGDGAARPGDCNDANPAIRPGAKDIPLNKIDEDCSGKDGAFPTLTSGVLPTWDIKGSRLTLVNLQITQQFPKGLKVKMLCKGSRCPFKSKSLKVGKLRRNAATAISSLSRRRAEVPSRTNTRGLGVGARLQHEDQPARAEGAQDPCQPAVLCPSGQDEGAEDLHLNCPIRSNDGPDLLQADLLGLTVSKLSGLASASQGCRTEGSGRRRCGAVEGRDAQ